MAIDPSVIQTQQKLPDFGQVGSGIQGTVGLLGSLQALQQQKQTIASNQAISQAIQQNTNPDGSINVDAVSQAIAKNPAAAYNLPQLQSQLYGAANARSTAQNTQLQNLHLQNQYWGSQLGALVSNPNVAPSDVSTVLIQGMKAGFIDPNTAYQYATQIPKDPAQLQGWLKQHYMATLSNDQQLQAMMPQVQVLNTGGQQNVVATNKLTGVPTLTGTLQNTLDPQTATSPVSTIGPDGQPMAITRQQFAGLAPGYTGRYPGGAPGQMPGAPGQPSGGIGVPTGLAPAAQASAVAGASAAATGAAQAAQALHTQAADAPVRVGYLRDAAAALDNIQTGPGTDWRNSFASALQSSPGLGAILQAAGVNDPTTISSYDEFKKIMTNYASGVSAGAGTGTDARLNAAITGNANPNISKLANQDIMVKAIAAENYRSAEDLAYQTASNSWQQSHGGQPLPFNPWQAQWNKNVDPAAFSYVEMNPQQQQSFIQRLQKSGKLDQFKSSFNNLVQQGVIPPPQAAGGQ